MAKQDAGDAGRRRNESVYHRHGGRYGRVKGRRQPRHERPERLLAASQDERARQRGDQVGDEHPRRDAAHRVDGRRTRQGEVACVVSARHTGRRDAHHRCGQGLESDVQSQLGHRENAGQAGVGTRCAERSRQRQAA